MAPNIDYNGVDMLPAGAVLGDEDYWTDFSRPANTALAIEWIERQIGNLVICVFNCFTLETCLCCIGLFNRKSGIFCCHASPCGVCYQQ